MEKGDEYGKDLWKHNIAKLKARGVNNCVLVVCILERVVLGIEWCFFREEGWSIRKIIQVERDALTS